MRNGLIVALIAGLSAGLSAGLLCGLFDGLSDGLLFGLEVGLLFGLIAGPIAGLAFGLDTAVQHGVFRLLLWAHHVTPLRTVRWLNYMVQPRFFIGVTGGALNYSFVILIMVSCSWVGRGPTIASVAPGSTPAGVLS